MTGLRRRTLLMLQKITVYLHNHQVPYTKCEWKLGGGGGVGGHTLLRPHTPLSKDMPGETQGTMTVPPKLKWEPAGDPSFLPGCRGGTLKAWFCPEPLTAKSRSILQGHSPPSPPDTEILSPRGLESIVHFIEKTEACQWPGPCASWNDDSISHAMVPMV